MASSYFVTVGPKAYSFYDQSTGINVIKGEVKELTAAQYRTKRVQMAFNSGHLVMVQNQDNVKKYSDADIDKLFAKMKKQLAKGMEISKIAKGYTLQEAQLVAKKNNVSYDNTDTVSSILTVLLSETEEEN